MPKKRVRSTDDPHQVYRVVSGNVIGVVEKPETIDPRKPLTEQYQVKIGVLDPEGELPKADAEIVIRKLRKFCEALR
jgi:hypothetical protein